MECISEDSFIFSGSFCVIPHMRLTAGGCDIDCDPLDYNSGSGGIGVL